MYWREASKISKVLVFLIFNEVFFFLILTSLNYHICVNEYKILIWNDPGTFLISKCILY